MCTQRVHFRKQTQQHSESFGCWRASQVLFASCFPCRQLPWIDFEPYLIVENCFQNAFQFVIFPYLDCIELSLKPLLANLLEMGWNYRLSPDERTKFRCTHLLDPPFSTINCEGFTAWQSSRQDLVVWAGVCSGFWDVSTLGRSEYNQYEPLWALAGQTGVYDLVNIHKAIENGHL
jgi:hypothetical protein